MESFPIDASGSLPDGKAINGAASLIGVLATERDAFTEAMAESC
jgi:hypothetical protein